MDVLEYLLLLYISILLVEGEVKYLKYNFELKDNKIIICECL